MSKTLFVANGLELWVDDLLLERLRLEHAHSRDLRRLSVGKKRKVVRTPEKSVQALLAALKPEGDCWVWQRGRNPKGYGKMGFMTRYWTVSRIVMWLMHGEIPSGIWVLHRCDNPPCANPDHLFFGNCKDNVKDSITKGRFGKGCLGVNQYKAKLTDDIVREIRSTYQKGSYQTGVRPLARRFGVTGWTVNAVLRFKTWKHIK